MCQGDCHVSQGCECGRQKLTQSMWANITKLPIVHIHFLLFSLRWPTMRLLSLHNQKPSSSNKLPLIQLGHPDPFICLLLVLSLETLRRELVNNMIMHETSENIFHFLSWHCFCFSYLNLSIYYDLICF